MDQNHGEIRDALRQAGAAVCSAASLGDGAPDLLVAFRGHVLLVEVKTARGQLTAAQQLFHAQFPVRVVRSVDEALALVRAVRTSKNT